VYPVVVLSVVASRVGGREGSVPDAKGLDTAFQIIDIALVEVEFDYLGGQSRRDERCRAENAQRKGGLLSVGMKRKVSEPLGSVSGSAGASAAAEGA
jgi:hypothetical protein